MPKVVFGKTGRKVPIARQFEIARYRFCHGYNTVYIENFPEYEPCIKRIFILVGCSLKKNHQIILLKPTINF